MKTGLLLLFSEQWAKLTQESYYQSNEQEFPLVTLLWCKSSNLPAMVTSK